MTTAMRAKVKVAGISQSKNADDVVTQEALTFSFPAKEGGYPADGSDEDQSFAKYTPMAHLSMTIANPELLGKFEVGDTFYLDFVPVE